MRGEKQEIVDVISRKRLCLLASHFIQTSYEQILENLTMRARGICALQAEQIVRHWKLLIRFDERDLVNGICDRVRDA